VNEKIYLAMVAAVVVNPYDGELGDFIERSEDS